MNSNYPFLILSALTTQNHSITSLMNLLNVDNSHIQEFSTLISNLAHQQYINYFESELCLTPSGKLHQQQLFEEWKQTNDLLFNVLKGTNNE